MNCMKKVINLAKTYPECSHIIRTYLEWMLLCDVELYEKSDKFSQNLPGMLSHNQNISGMDVVV